MNEKCEHHYRIMGGKNLDEDSPKSEKVYYVLN